MPGRPWILAESAWPAVAATPYEVAVLPWGATEAHNRHLPYGTDTIQSDAIAAESARLAWDAGARVVVLPAVPFGVQTGQREIPFCLNMNPSTQALVLGDLLESLEGRVRKLVVLNGHGGNHFRQAIRELQPKTAVFLSAVDWYRVVDPRDHFDEPGDHAGELETSVMLHVAPGLVAPLAEAGDGRERRFSIPALREGWAWAPRHWVQATADTGIGDPRAATAEKGSRYADLVARRIASYLVELASADPGALYR